MRILFLLSSLQTGGAERVAATLANAWVEKGHAVDLIPTYGGATERCAFTLRSAVEVKPLARSIGSKGRLPAKVAALRKLMAGGSYDVVCSFLTNVNVTALLAGLGTNMPIVVSERSFPPSYAIGAPLTLARRALYPFADRVVMQTEEGLSWLHRAIPGARGAAVANALTFPVADREPTQRVSERIGAQRRMLLAVGRLSTEKRFGWLIEQFARLAAELPDWDLVIAGDGPQRATLEARCHAIDSGERIKLVGEVGNLDDWYRRADAFALVSRFEGYPNALAEAASYGVPALAIDCPTGPSQLVIDGETGVLLPRTATGADLRDGLERLLCGRYPASEAWARTIRQRLDTGRVAGQWLEIFEMAITARRGRR